MAKNVLTNVAIASEYKSEFDGLFTDIFPKYSIKAGSVILG